MGLQILSQNPFQSLVPLSFTGIFKLAMDSYKIAMWLFAASVISRWPLESNTTYWLFITLLLTHFWTMVEVFKYVQTLATRHL
jgi:hypothetical protein